MEKSVERYGTEPIVVTWQAVELVEVENAHLVCMEPFFRISGEVITRKVTYENWRRFYQFGE